MLTGKSTKRDKTAEEQERFEKKTEVFLKGGLTMIADRPAEVTEKSADTNGKTRGRPKENKEQVATILLRLPESFIHRIDWCIREKYPVSPSRHQWILEAVMRSVSEEEEKFAKK